jgi:CRISPR-associated protein Csm1
MINHYPNVEGFVKRLRGRSFFVSILPEIISKSILDSINYPIFNTIYVGGGKFQLLFNIKFLNEVVEKLNEINKMILESFSGGLGLTFAYVEIMLDDLKNYKKKSKELFQRLEREKFRKFYKILNNVSLKIKDNDICPSCRIETKYYDEEFCDWCKKFEELGEKLLKGSFLVFSNNRGIGLKNVGYIDILENYPIDEDFYILNILSEALLDYGFKFINFIQEIKPFSELVEGEGYKKLAYLKIDVNKLGFKFSQVDSFFEVSRLSRFIDLFFSMYLKFIFEKYKNYIYVIYSGGDDLFLVGRWDKIIELAIEINKEFKEWTINDLSISASINLFDYNYPFKFAAEITSKNLDIAKEEGKEVFILNKFVSFDELEDVYNDAKKKAEEYKGKISRSLIHRIYMMLKRKYLFFPMFYYQIYRNISDDCIREDFKSKIIDKKDMKIRESSEIFLELLLMKTREVKQ